MTDAAPRVNIALPTHNGARYLRECLENIAGQTYREFSVLILDNASTDETPLIANEFARNDPRFQVVRHEAKLSAFDNFAEGLARATAPLFLWRADDDMWANDYLEKLVALRDANPEARLAVAMTVQQTVKEGSTEVRGVFKSPGGFGSAPSRAHLLLRSSPSWVYGLFDTATLRPVLKQVYETYKEAWGGDQLIVFNYVMRGLIVGTDETTFTMRRFFVQAAAQSRWKKGDTPREVLDFDTELRKRFYQIAAGWIDGFWSGRLQRIKWRLLLFHFMARRIMPARTIWRRRIRSRFQEMLRKSAP